MLIYAQEVPLIILSKDIISVPDGLVIMNTNKKEVTKLPSNS
jgi:hypothetical protein